MKFELHNTITSVLVVTPIYTTFLLNNSPDVIKC